MQWHDQLIVVHYRQVVGYAAQAGKPFVRKPMSAVVIRLAGAV